MQVCEQAFKWLAGYKKVASMMGEYPYRWLMLRMMFMWNMNREVRVLEPGAVVNEFPYSRMDSLLFTCCCLAGADTVETEGEGGRRRRRMRQQRAG